MRDSKSIIEFQITKNSVKQDIALPSYKSPIRVGPQTQYGNNRWEVYSPKLKRNVTLYSNLEYDHWVLIEANPHIQTFCEQPLKIRIKLPLGDVTTIFDMWVRWKGGREEFREIKYKSDLNKTLANSRCIRQVEAQMRWCELQNKNYKVITDETIRANPTYLSNWKLILQHLAYVQDIDLKPYLHQIVLKLSLKGESTIVEIEKALPDIEPSLVRSSIFTLLHLGELSADALKDKCLDRKTCVRLINNESRS
jgi:hypothetical protein